jgi:hypothetical protein
VVERQESEEAEQASGAEHWSPSADQSQAVELHAAGLFDHERPESGQSVDTVSAKIPPPPYSAPEQAPKAIFVNGFEVTF